MAPNGSCDATVPGIDGVRPAFLLSSEMVRAVNNTVNGDLESLLGVAPQILGTSQVATTTARRLMMNGIDVAGLVRVFAERGNEIAIVDYYLKRIAAAPETPENFGLFARRL